MAHYLTDEDITDNIAAAYISKKAGGSWHDQTDEEINSLAGEFNIAYSGIAVPLNPTIKKYARAYFCKILFRDLLGTNLGNNPDVASIEQDKYKIKYDIYEKECSALRMAISKNMFFNSLETGVASDHVNGITMWAGC
jgi:hypothetical protein